jgi:hypothetical protein
VCYIDGVKVCRDTEIFCDEECDCDDCTDEDKPCDTSSTSSTSSITTTGPCEYSEWEDGVCDDKCEYQTDTRTVVSGDPDLCLNVEREVECKNTSKCACVVDGVEYLPGEKFEEDCKVCECAYNFTYTCTAITCPAISDCGEGEGVLVLPEGECCHVCETTTSTSTTTSGTTTTTEECHLETSNLELSIGDCTSEPVTISYCTGGCSLANMADNAFEMNLPVSILDSISMQSNCRCCTGQEGTPLEVEFNCTDGNKYTKKVPTLESCACDMCQE